MKRIALAGGPGSGKTSLARHLVTQLYNVEEPKRNAQHVPEFARDYINAARTQQDGKFHASLADQQMIYRTQLAREDSLGDPVEFLVTDSPIFLPLVFSYPLVEHTFQSRAVYLHLYEEWLATQTRRYDYVYVLEREGPLLQDGTRGEDEQTARQIDCRVRAFLDLHLIPYREVQGDAAARVQTVLRDLRDAGDL